jgi:hypothetical protein
MRPHEWVLLRNLSHPEFCMHGYQLVYRNLSLTVLRMGSRGLPYSGLADALRDERNVGKKRKEAGGFGRKQ